MFGADEDRLERVEDLASLDPLDEGCREVLPTRGARRRFVLDDHIRTRDDGEVLSAAPGCLPRRRATSSLRCSLASARRSARVLVASAWSAGESLDGGRDEFFELWLIRASSSAIMRVSLSIS